MFSWLKRLIVEKLEDEAQAEMVTLIKAEQAKAQAVDPNVLAKKIVVYVNDKLGLTGGK